MAKWVRPSEAMPKVWVGDRVVIVVAERASDGTPLRPTLVILTATEDGWSCGDATYHGYTPEDGLFWSTERDVCAFARALSPEAFV